MRANCALSISAKMIWKTGRRETGGGGRQEGDEGRRRGEERTAREKTEGREKGKNK